jgi:uncharacterized protein (TIGR03084 family)
MAVDLQELLRDLAAETEDVVGLLEPLAPSDYERPTPAAGWAVRDQVSHLAYFDETATLAAVDPDRFRRDAAELMARGTDFADVLAGDFRSMPASDLLPWFQRARRELLTTYQGMDARDRVPWYGPDMSAASCITARLMETWAHGQDIADTFDREREPTSRLRHIADLGVRTMGFSFALNDRPVPTRPVGVTLRAPGGDTWTWSAESQDHIEGSALDFCLVVTQRRPLGQTNLEVTGSLAHEWMSVAQAFAGPPGPGRPTADADMPV